MRVLVTRPEPEARRTAATLAARGHEAILAPLTRVVPLHPLLVPRDAQALVATSARAFVGLDLTPVRHLPLYAVGARTAEAAARNSLRLAAPAAPDAETLADLMSTLAPTRLLYLAGRDRKPLLEERLRAAGHAVRTVETYAAEAVDDLPEPARTALGAGALDAVLHHSRRHTALFRELVHAAGLSEAAARPRHVCLSADVAAALEGLAPSRIAGSPNEAALLEALDAP